MPETRPDHARMSALLHDYYVDIVAGLVALGGPDVPPAVPVQDFWDHVDDFLPPRGRICIGVAPDGRWLGCGTLSALPGARGELKRLFVRPEARGTGLGRALVERRLDEARAMGLKTILVDTLRHTAAMQALYRSLGFREIDRYPESSTANTFPELRPHMLYFRMDL
ncbi:hypothetical protein AVJ23_11240 [Pseudoponticoccus marisrubri]|uniref:N-acetyltransferase domain-containing protein n=2 Tax=Pseudoponticoccus marisrubri TaxID=1685382 RepID=A0A0W7WIS2_9RHOB|nr:hypothetical protein AVJ23_11240 [Pseudoponticoccus marisrubri]